MCRYCAVDEYGEGFNELPLRKNYHKNKGLHTQIFLNDGKELMATVCYYENDALSDEYQVLPINYCPMCGRKLTKD